MERWTTIGDRVANESPTGELRFMNRGGKKILQQRWIVIYALSDYEYIWRDVEQVEWEPTGDESADPS